MTDIQKGKDSLMKKLLSTAPNMSPLPSISISQTPTPSEYSSNLPSPVSEISSEETSTKLKTFLRQLASQTGRELNIVFMDHAYSKPGNWRSDNSYAKPTKCLFVLEVPPLTGTSNKDVDVEDVDETPIPPYDLKSVKISMSECETYIDSVKPGDKGDDWEEQVNKTGWTMTQQRVFAKITRALNLDRLARLSCEGNWNEPVQRRVIVDKTSRRFRHVLSCYAWEPRLTYWLHTTLLDNLSPIYLAIYIDMLQTLQSKCPSLVDRMLASAPIVSRPGLSGLESLNLIVKQPWDPVVSSLNEHKPQRLPGNPILVMVPSTPMNGSFLSPRLKQWESYFSSLGTVYPVIVKAGPEMNKMTLTNCLDQMVCATRVKVAQLRNEYPGRRIILVGWNAGSAIATQVALVEQVSAVICLGFPVLTVEGKRGEPNDTLLDLRCPVYFVVGENAASVREEDMEDIRERMRVETGLVVVGSADDLLRVGHTKKQREGLIQSMVDRCILDEVGDFLGSILMSPRPPPLRTISNQSTNLSAVSSVDVVNNGMKEHKRKVPCESAPLLPGKRSRPGTPLHGLSSVTPTVTSTTIPTSKSTLTMLPTLVSVTGVARQKSRLPGPKLPQTNTGNPEAKFPIPTSSQQSAVSDTATSTSSGITVNIGSLGSLAPLGPIRLTQTSTPSSSTSTSSPVSSGSDGNLEGLSGRSRPTSLTIQGNLISSVQTVQPVQPVQSGIVDRSLTPMSKGSGLLSKGSLQLQGKQLVGRTIGKTSDSSPLTTISSLLQGQGTRLMVSSASSLLMTPSLTTTAAGQHLKVLGSDENVQDMPMSTLSTMGTPRLRTSSGRMVDLSKFVLTPTSTSGTVKNVLSATSTGNVVMLSDTSRSARPPNSGPLLVPVSNVSSPFTILPLAGKTTKPNPDRSPLQRSYTVIPKISVPSLKLTQPQVSASSGTKLTYPVTSTLLQDSTELGQSVEMISESRKMGDRREEEDSLTPDKILDLPIIFAKDGDDSLFVDNKMETESANTPTVVPISSCGSSDTSSTVTLGDTISFPLDDMESDRIQPLSCQRGVTSVPNVFIIRSKNGGKEKAQLPPGKRILQKTRFIRAPDKIQTSSQANQSPATGVKYTKIILTNRNSSLKVGDQEAGTVSGFPLKRSTIGAIDPGPSGNFILDDDFEVM